MEWFNKLSVLGGVTQKRALASQIMGIGQTAEEIVLNLWNGKEFAGLEFQLISLITQVGQLTEQQLSYPILHRYHGADPNNDSAGALAVSHDALTLIRFGIKEEYQPAHSLLYSTRQSIESYLKTLASSAIYPSKRLPPPPNLSKLREAGLPVISDQEFSQSLEDLEHRCKLLFGLVQDNSFRWYSTHQ